MDSRNSTLYQIDNAMAELHFAMFKAIDPTSWIDTNQFIVSTNHSTVDIRREFENRYGKFNYPSMVITRNPRFSLQSHNNMNVQQQYIVQDDYKISVRPITLEYSCSIYDYRRQYIDEYYEFAVMELYKYAPRIDVKCKIGVDESNKDFVAHNLTSVSYDIESINIDAQPNYDDKTNNTGQIYVLNIPFTVDTQLLGNYQKSKLIHRMIVNYIEMKDGGFKETDEFSTVPKDINIEEGN